MFYVNPRFQSRNDRAIGQANQRLHPTPLRGPKIGGMLQSRFVLTGVPTYRRRG